MVKVGIIGAMEIEVKLLIAKMLSPKETVAAGLSYYEGKLENVDVVVVRSGIGKVNAALCAQRLSLQFGVTHIINTGIAGAMASGLSVLDMVVSTDAIYHDFDVTGFGYKPCVIPQMDISDFVADEKLVNLSTEVFESLASKAGSLFEGHKIIAGRIASGDQFISSKEQKSNIRSLCNPACVEMEGAAIAHAAYLCKVPFIIIRCMSDMADDNGENTYNFNEELAAKMSAELVLNMLPRI